MRRLVTFSLEGTATLPPQNPPMVVTPLADTEFEVDQALLGVGDFEYETTCVLCHGPGAISGGMAPDLRASAVVLSAQSFERVVRQGDRANRGMPPFPDLTDEGLESIRHYIRWMAETSASEAAASGAGQTRRAQ